MYITIFFCSLYGMEDEELVIFIRKVGERIREIRKSKDLTQVDLAAKVGIDERHLLRIEKGQTRTSLKNLFRISRALDLEVRDLFPVNDKLE